MKKTHAFLLLPILFWQCTSGSRFEPGNQRLLVEEVVVTSPFWLARIDSNHVNGIPGCFESCDHSLVNFDIAAGVSNAERTGTEASDSDVYKIIQGAALSLKHHSDPKLESFVDELIDKIEAAQLADGYLHTYWTIHDLNQRWTQVKTKHELYNAGHLFEAAADYYEVTGKEKLLNIAEKFAAHIDSVFGYDALQEVSGHQEIELALIRLYEVTGKSQYLDMATYFLEERGNPERLEKEVNIGENDAYANTPKRWLKSSYRQDHLPLVDQREATGHAVRAAYMYRSMTGWANTTQNDKYDEALQSLWNDIVSKRIYLTGAIGTAQFHDEGFGSDYNLPTHAAYCETCSAIALMLWNQSMYERFGDAKFADLLEVTLYNGGLSGGSASGDQFFYTNPIEGEEKHQRRSWYEPGCCPSNYVRFIPMIHQLIYAQDREGVIVNQYISSEAKVKIKGKEVQAQMQTNYPFDHNAQLSLDLKGKQRFTLKLRVPGWTKGRFMPGDLYHYQEDPGAANRMRVILNKTELNLEVNDQGYLCIDRKWSGEDQLIIEFPLTPKLIKGRAEIESVRGKLALTRGPVVYCLEEIDNPEPFNTLSIFKYEKPEYTISPDDSIIHGINAIVGLNQNFRAIPYFAWNNRGNTRMRIWF